MNSPSLKPEPQLALEALIQSNADEAKRLLDANDRIYQEMSSILKSTPGIALGCSACLRWPELRAACLTCGESTPPPPTSDRLVEAFQSGTRATQKSERYTVPVANEEPVSTRMAAKEEVLYAALAIVRSWHRRHKKNWQSQERELEAAVQKLTWDK